MEENDLGICDSDLVNCIAPSKKARLSLSLKRSAISKARFRERRSEREVVKGYIPKNTAKSTLWAVKRSMDGAHKVSIEEVQT